MIDKFFSERVTLVPFRHIHLFFTFFTEKQQRSRPIKFQTQEDYFLFPQIFEKIWGFLQRELDNLPKQGVSLVYKIARL